MMKGEFKPIRTVKEISELDGKEIEDGYFAGRGGYVLEGIETRSFIHGWRNGVVDSGVAMPDEAQQEFARDVLKARREGKFNF